MNIFFCNVPTAGHVNPSLPLARSLVQRGHEVVYYLTDRYRARVVATGAAYRPTPGLAYKELSPPGGKFNPAALGAGLFNDTAAVLPQLLADIEREQPAVIVYDSMCPWGYFAARLSGRPAVASMALMQPTPGFVRRSLLRLWPWLLPMLPRTLASLPRLRRAARRLAAQTPGVAVRLGDVLNWAGDLNLCHTSAHFQPEAATLGDHYLFLGPGENKAAAADIDFPLAELDTSRPLVYVTLGSVFSANAHFFRRALAGLAELECQVVLSTGRRVAPAALAPIPANAHVYDWVPQRAIMARAALCVTHAGMNTVQEGLEFGVPQLLVPQQLEQAFVARRVEMLGAGLMVSWATPGRLRRRAARLLAEPAFATQAAAAGAAGDADASLDDAVAAITAAARE